MTGTTPDPPPSPEEPDDAAAQDREARPAAPPPGEQPPDARESGTAPASAAAPRAPGRRSRRPEPRWRSFLRTETGSAALLLLAVALALVWANLDVASYERVRHTELALTLGPHRVGLPLQEWVNSGLMTFFFLVVGLEARREFDLGELRDRGWVLLSVLAGLSGMVVPALLYVALNAGTDTAGGWGVAISTDTAFALGMLPLLRGQLPGGLRTFLLSLSVVDDLAALVVVATVYSDEIAWLPLLVAVAALGAIVALRLLGVRHGGPTMGLAVVVWLALLEAGVDPVITGLVVGGLMLAYPAHRGDLERASGLFRAFREQPTPALARSARLGLTATISPNERLEQRYRPWTTYAIVPLFALANAGVPLGPGELADAFSSSVTWGVVLGCLVGKFLGVLAPLLLAGRLSGGRLRPPVGWGAVAAGGTLSGAVFTVSLLIAALAFDGADRRHATIGIFTTLLGAYLLTRLVTGALALLPPRRRVRALLGTGRPLTDLAVPVDERDDHTRGPRTAPVTLVEYGDYECPYCGQAEPAVRELLARFGDEVRYVWRHLPLDDVHPQARLAALAAEAAGAQGAFWQMHDRLFQHQDALTHPELVAHADQLGLDTEKFSRHLTDHGGQRRLERDMDSADLSSVSGTPTFFVNGLRHRGAYDLDALQHAVHLARKRVLLGPPPE